MTESSSIDPAEVAKFSAIAAEWWDPAGKFAPLHKFNPVRLGFIRQEAARQFGRSETALRPFEGLTLLDIGCGEGWLLAAALAEGYDVQGLDFSDDGMRRFHPELAARAQFGDAFEGLDALIEADQGVDVCTLEHVLEHVLDPEGLLARLPRLLKPGGVVAITVPNDFSRLQTRALASGAVDRAFWVAPPQHLNYFNTETLPPLMARLGFEVRCTFASFPIDWFLLHPGSNYIADPANGKAAHRARMDLDLMLAEAGMEAYLNLARALFACGAGRSITVIAGLA